MVHHCVSDAMLLEFCYLMRVETVLLFAAKVTNQIEVVLTQPITASALVQHSFVEQVAAC